MPQVLIVDGADVCRAPIMEFTLQSGMADGSWLHAVRVLSRGLEAESDRRMCQVAAGRIGFSTAAVGFFGAHRAQRLTTEDIAESGLILTAEREQRSAVVRMLPGTQARIFTWKEARVLATIVTERVAAGKLAPPTDLDDLARQLHASRGTIPVIEPPVRTAAFHWRRQPAHDPLSVPGGHDESAALHKHAIDESRATATALIGLFADLARTDRHDRLDTARPDWWRRGA